MKALMAKAADKFLSFSAKTAAKTGCVFWCHNEEIPSELL